MAYVVYKDAIDYLNKIAEYSHEHAQITLEKVGMDIREILIAKARSYGRVKPHFFRYGHTDKHGHRYMRLKRASYLRNPYERYEGNVRTGDDEPDKLGTDLADMIRSKPYHDLGKVVVGWMDTGSYKTKLLKKGVKGTKTAKIGERMENGETIQLSERSQRMRWYSGFKGGGRSIRAKAYPVVNPSFGQAQTQALKKAKEQYEKLMEKYDGYSKSRSA